MVETAFSILVAMPMLNFMLAKQPTATDTWCISANQNLGDYLYLLLLSIKPELNKNILSRYWIKTPSETFA